MLVLLVAGCAGGTAPSPVADTSGPALTVVEPADDPSHDAAREDAPGSTLATGGRPRRAELSIPSIGLQGLVVEPYRGRTDDAAGTRLQDQSVAAAPYGPHGGAGPGGVGNYQVTAHRNSSTGAFFDLPLLQRGERVFLDIDGVRLTYRVTGTRRTSFRSPQSLAEQRAAVPGRPGERPTRPMITLSTCATQEDHAAGNHWADEFDNPEHRIDKIGVLVASTPVPPTT